MNWVEVLWPLVAATSLVFGLVHLLIWSTREREHAHLALAVAAFSLGTLTVLERWAMFSASPMQMAALIRWMHVPVAFLVVAMICAVHLTFSHGSAWLAGAVIGLRALAVVLDFTTGVNLNFLTIDHIEWSLWWGVAIANPIGQPNPAQAVALISNVLLMVFIAQTLVRGWRAQPARRRTLAITCGACLLLVAMLMGATLCWMLQLPRLPLTLPGALVLLLVAGCQLGNEFIRRARLERRLQQSELQRLEAVRDLDMAALTSGLGLWEWDAAAHTFTQNSHNRRLVGDPAQAVATDAGEPVVTSSVGEPAATLFARVAAEEVAALTERFGKAIRQPTFELEYAVREADGTRQWVCLRGSAEHDAGGAPLKVRGLTQDVSGRRREEKQVRAVLDASPTALLLVDRKGEIRYANEQSAVIFGYEHDGMRGIRAERVLPFRIDAATVGQPGREGHPAPGADALLGRTRCGREFPVEVILSPLELDGQAHVVAAVNDLTEKRQAEQEMAFERESMAHMSRVTLIAEISGSLAHELNQPLAAILSNAQAAQRILRRDPADITDIREILDDIVENDRRAGEVISRLRGLLKKECRAFTTLAVNDVVHDAIRIIRNDLINRGVEYRLDLTVPMCRVQGDPVQLQQVLLNLILNACDAMAGHDRRVLTLRTCAPSESRIRVEVRDTGDGIPDDMLDVVFAPFQTSKPSGMGMGLAICRTLLRAHGGRIWAANHAGGGASLFFELPIQE